MAIRQHRRQQQLAANGQTQVMTAYSTFGIPAAMMATSLMPTPAQMNQAISRENEKLSVHDAMAKIKESHARQAATSQEKVASLKASGTWSDSAILENSLNGSISSIVRPFIKKVAVLKELPTLSDSSLHFEVDAPSNIPNDDIEIASIVFSPEPSATKTSRSENMNIVRADASSPALVVQNNRPRSTQIETDFEAENLALGYTVYSEAVQSHAPPPDAILMLALGQPPKSTKPNSSITSAHPSTPPIVKALLDPSPLPLHQPLIVSPVLVAPRAHSDMTNALGSNLELARIGSSASLRLQSPASASQHPSQPPQLSAKAQSVLSTFKHKFVIPLPNTSKF